MDADRTSEEEGESVLKQSESFWTPRPETGRSFEISASPALLLMYKQLPSVCTPISTFIIALEALDSRSFKDPALTGNSSFLVLINVSLLEQSLFSIFSFKSGARNQKANSFRFQPFFNCIVVRGRVKSNTTAIKTVVA